MSVLNILEEKLAETKNRDVFASSSTLNAACRTNPGPPATDTKVSAVSTSGARTTIWR